MAKLTQSEASILSQIEKWLDSEALAGNCYYFKTWGNMYTSGQLDLVICWRGNFVGIDTKRRGKTPKPGQKLTKTEVQQIETIRAIRAAGGQAYFVESLGQLQNILFPLARVAPPPPPPVTPSEEIRARLAKPLELELE